MKAEIQAQKARNSRYKRAALALIQRETIADELYAISNECNDLELAVEDDEMLLDVFDGDSDEINEFRMMFADLSAKCERLSNTLSDEYVTEHFDDFFVGSLGRSYAMVGYDTVEEDYFNLTRFEAELAESDSGKRLMGLTKKELIAISGQCTGIMISFLDIRHSYDCLKSTLDMLRDDRTELMKNIRGIEESYKKTQKDDYDYAARRNYDDLLSRLPGIVWVQ